MRFSEMSTDQFEAAYEAHLDEMFDAAFGVPTLWSADDCCAAFQTGACCHTESGGEYDDPEPLLRYSCGHVAWTDRLLPGGCPECEAQWLADEPF